ncbi:MULTISPECIES: rhamnulokinase [Bacteria]|uniref:rhamnulokinase n=1 Tax=Bacteria TaxID=2 RepID=UPI003C7D8910
MSRAGGAVAAVDLGATSGRVMIGRVTSTRVTLEPVARFPHESVRRDDGLHWDFAALSGHVLDGLAEAMRREPALTSAGIDSWAVDYGLLQAGELLGEPFHYRDERTAHGVERVHAHLPFPALHARNGLQFLPFTTLYQLAADPLLPRADTLLLIPDLLVHLLTGARAAERTNASTTGLLRADGTGWDVELAEEVGIPAGLLPPLIDPGDRIGAVRAEAARHIGAALPVVAVGSHDTASAVAATPLSSPGSAYISCGTWGLVGVELTAPVRSDAARDAGFTNERGVDGRIRFLRNVAGLWLLSESVRAWEEREGAPIDLRLLLDEAESLPAGGPLFDANHPSLAAPGDMPARIAALLREAGDAVPSTRAAFTRCVVESIAAAFAEAVAAVARLTGRSLDRLHLVGGGSLNRLLCRATARRTGLPVLAGPIEATALGNVLVQARAHGWLGAGATLEDLRALVAASFPPVRFDPEDES